MSNKTRHAGNPAERNMDHPMHSNMYMMDSDPIESHVLAKCPDWVNYPDFHTTSEDHAAWIINLQTGCLASGVSVGHNKLYTCMRRQTC
jgi:hypothetical protein